MSSNKPFGSLADGGGVLESEIFSIASIHTNYCSSHSSYSIIAVVTTLSFIIPLAAYLWLMHIVLSWSFWIVGVGNPTLPKFTIIDFFVFEHILPSSPKIRVSFVVGLHQYPTLVLVGDYQGFPLARLTHYLQHP